MRRVAVVPLVLMLVLLAAASAPALPGDPPLEPLTPADGASLPVDPDGIPVTFTCPVYRTSDAGGGFAAYGGPTEYGVSMSRGTALGADGRLADPVAVISPATPVPGQAGQCSARLAAGGGQRPQETPGAYSWQVTRICAGCELGYEVGPVRKLTLVSTAKPALAVPGKVYAGYPFIATVAAEGVPAGTAVTVERRSGGGWARAGAGFVLGGAAAVTTTLPRAGRQQLRARLAVGAQELASATRAATVRSAATASKIAVRAGGWSGRSGLSFRVVGRTIRGFTAQVPMLCPTPGMVSPFTTQIGTAAVAAIHLAPDGSFVGAATRSGSAMRVRGRLSGGRSSGGRVELSLGGCQGDAAFSARRGS
jgi:hypothetical protein